MLQCGSSLRTFVHLAAFLLAETSVCGQSAISLQAQKTERDYVGISTDGELRSFAVAASNPQTSWLADPHRRSDSQLLACLLAQHVSILRGGV
jgi:hypothetical protein